MPVAAGAIDAVDAVALPDVALPDVSELPVGGGLVDVLAGVEVADTSDAGLLDVAARWQDVVSWATAMQSRVLGEIGRRRGWTEEHSAAAAEISARLRVPQGEANKHMARGAGLAEHTPVLTALQHGLIDVAKADILLRSGNPLTTEERAEAIALYLPQAPEHTRRWLRDKMNEFANGLKGTIEVVKHARARRAVFLDPADNAMAWLSANLPATDAAAVWDAIEQAAHTLRRSPGATRTLAQARADALVAITTGRLIVPPTPECAPTGEGTATTGTTTRTGAGTTGTGTGNTDETTATNAGTPAGVSGSPVESHTVQDVTMATPDSGPVIDGRATDESARDGSTRRGSTRKGSARNGPATAESGESGANGSGAAESGAVGPDEPSVPRTTVPATGCTCGGCTCGGTSIRVVPVRPQIRITISAGALLGLDDTPGQLDGYGPIPADIAAQIAADATWQRLLTDPVTGILTDYSTTTYQPGKVLRQAVIARDHTCGFLQCERPGRWADLDHIVPYDHQLDPTTLPPGTPGQTRATNLQPLCRAHHLAKTHHGWTPVRDPDTGITTWTAPTGHTYTRPATQTGQVTNDATSLTKDTRIRLGQPPLNQHSTADPASEQPPTEQRLRRFPDQPPF
ncbi:HNH endonuclease [Promicromonospora sp. NPDC057138]|uniref:HNH endonuclease n=1 Tax=Promicromonospora sp. NPDC057138 TaxID=3346031 RepID=UPI003636A299